LLRIPTGRRLTSWLFTKRGGVEFGTTEDKSIQWQGAGLEPDLEFRHNIVKVTEVAKRGTLFTLKLFFILYHIINDRYISIQTLIFYAVLRTALEEYAGNLDRCAYTSAN